MDGELQFCFPLFFPCVLYSHCMEWAHNPRPLNLKITSVINFTQDLLSFYRWNFSVGQQDLNFLEGLSEDYDSSCPLQDEAFSPKWKLRVSIPNGLVAGVHREAGGPVETVLWSHKFESPVAAVWTLNDGHLQSVDLFREDVMPEVAEGTDYQKNKSQKPMMYIG